jgi:hypothetical protein
MPGILLALGLALFAGLGGDLKSYLPAARDLPGWAPSGEPQHYVGEDLYTYIDGGAEIYQEYGFKQVLAQDYKDAGGRTLTLELYEMNSPEAAYGAFTFKSSGKGKGVAVGQAAELEDYYLNAWKGTIVLTVIGPDDSAASLAGIQAVAKAAAAKIPAAGTRPALMNRLPGDWAGTPHIKFFTGPLGLFNIDPFFKGDVFRCRAGAAAERDGDWLFLFQYADGAESLRRLAEISDRLSKDDSVPQFTALAAPEFTGRSGKGRYFRARAAGDLIVLAWTGKGAAAAEKILEPFGR